MTELTLVQTIRERLADGSETAAHAYGRLLPQRGDDVADWLKGYRDGLTQGTTAWYAVDDLLDEYRLRADLGLTLTDELAWKAVLS